MVSLFMGNFSTYAKPKSDPSFPDAPIDQEGHDEGHSEAIIYSPLKGLPLVTPLNPTPSIIDEKEKKLYDTYIVDVNTLEKRIEYFSPTYQNIISGINAQLISGIASAGVNPESVDTLGQTIDDTVTQKRQVVKGLDLAKETYKKLHDQGLPDTDPLVAPVLAKIQQLTVSRITLDMMIPMLRSGHSTMAMALSILDRANHLTGNKIDLAKNQLLKGMVTGLIGCKQLEYYENLTKRQVDLYNRQYEIVKNNISLGLSTEKDREEAKLTLDTTIDSYNALKAQKDDAKNQLTVNLGYNMSDIDKVIFNEPEIDYEKILSIDPKNDYDRACYSNPTYQSIQANVQSSKNRGDDYTLNIYNKYKDEYRQKITNNLDAMYANLVYTYQVYDSMKPMIEAYEMDVRSLKTMKEQGLVSEPEAIGLDAKNMATEFNIQRAKYALISAYYDYYFYSILFSTGDTPL
ncbi:MAG: hypothetical protein MJ151_02415, partial [Lachnospiraceae bacterium]|nr:hypothetical protein [Lachnospiraceae bacterium]